MDERLDLAMDTIGLQMVVCDVIMNPPQTDLLRTAASHGATVLDGRGMLVNQAAFKHLELDRCASRFGSTSLRTGRGLSELKSF